MILLHALVAVADLSLDGLGTLTGLLGLLGSTDFNLPGAPDPFSPFDLPGALPPLLPGSAPGGGGGGDGDEPPDQDCEE